jgi:AcrR family transcriptional regulator
MLTPCTIDSTNNKRDDIVRQAYDAFYRHGFRATAVDKMLADSGISKRTVYKYFRSKEDLIAAAIDYYQAITLRHIAEELAARASDAREKLLAIFDLKYEAFEQGNYSGCFAINAKLEYAGKIPEIERASSSFFIELEKFILSLCKEAGCKNPPATATQITLLLEGTIVHAQAQRNSSIALVSREMARSILESAI